MAFDQTTATEALALRLENERLRTEVDILRNDNRRLSEERRSIMDESCAHAADAIAPVILKLRGHRTDVLIVNVTDIEQVPNAQLKSFRRYLNKRLRGQRIQVIVIAGTANLEDHLLGLPPQRLTDAISDLNRALRAEGIAKHRIAIEAVLGLPNVTFQRGREGWSGPIEPSEVAHCPIMEVRMADPTGDDIAGDLDAFARARWRSGRRD